MSHQPTSAGNARLVSPRETVPPQADRTASPTPTPTPHAITVRAATAADLDAVTELRLALLSEHRANPLYARPRTALRTRARHLFARQLASTREVTLLAFQDDAPVAVLRCVDSEGYPLMHPARYGYLTSAYVRPSLRRAGILRQMLEVAVDWCRGRGLTQLRLHSVAHAADANGAWETLGFEIAEHLRVRSIS